MTTKLYQNDNMLDVNLTLLDRPSGEEIDMTPQRTHAFLKVARYGSYKTLFTRQLIKTLDANAGVMQFDLVDRPFRGEKPGLFWGEVLIAYNCSSFSVDKALTENLKFQSGSADIESGEEYFVSSADGDFQSLQFTTIRPVSDASAPKEFIIPDFDLSLGMAGDNPMTLWPLLDTFTLFKHLKINLLQDFS